MSKGKAATADKGAPASAGDASAVTATANESGELGSGAEASAAVPPSGESEALSTDTAPPGGEGSNDSAPGSADLSQIGVYAPGVYVAAWPIAHDGREYAAGESLEGVEFEALAILAGCGAAVLVK